MTQIPFVDEPCILVGKLSEHRILAVGLLVIVKVCFGAIVTVPICLNVPHSPSKVTVITSLLLKVTEPNFSFKIKVFLPVVVLSMIILSTEPVMFLILSVSSLTVIGSQSLALNVKLKVGFAKTSIVIGVATSVAQSFFTVNLSE